MGYERFFSAFYNPKMVVDAIANKTDLILTA
jgi:hypothetical protein